MRYSLEIQPTTALTPFKEFLTRVKLPRITLNGETYAYQEDGDLPRTIVKDHFDTVLLYLRAHPRRAISLAVHVDPEEHSRSPHYEQYRLIFTREDTLPQGYISLKRETYSIINGERYFVEEEGSEEHRYFPKIRFVRDLERTVELLHREQGRYPDRVRLTLEKGME